MMRSLWICGVGTPRIPSQRIPLTSSLRAAQPKMPHAGPNPALKPNGLELGKEDPAYPGAQRFLVTLSQEYGQIIGKRVTGRSSNSAQQNVTRIGARVGLGL